jgi:hypothetical protein
VASLGALAAMTGCGGDPSTGDVADLSPDDGVVVVDTTDDRRGPGSRPPRDEAGLVVGEWACHET